MQPLRTTTLHSLPTLLFMAWRNLWRNPWRSLLTVSALAGGLLMMIFYAALLEGMMRQMVQHATEINTGHLQIHRQAYHTDQDLYATLPWNYLDSLEQQFPTLHFAPRLYASALASASENSTGVLLKAVDPQREATVTRLLHHVRQGEVDLGVADTANGLTRYNLVVGAQLAKQLQLAPGNELILVTQAADGSIGNALFRVAAVLKPIEPGFDRMGILMSIPAYQQLMALESGMHELVIKLADIDQLDSMQRRLATALHQLVAARPLDTLGGAPQVRSWQQLTPTVADMLALSHSMVLIVGLIVISLAALGMLNTLLMAVYERTHEFGILLAIGMPRRLLVMMVLFESSLLALLSALLGTLAGLIVVGYFATHGIDFSHYMPDGYDWAGIVFEPVMQVYLAPSHLLSACVLMFSVTLLTALLPAWQMARLQPAEVLR